MPSVAPSAPVAAARLLLKGRPQTDGFLFHDGYGQPVHQAAPGLLGLLEARHLVERWKPPIVAWMDGAGHFFNHLLHEFDGEPSFDPLRFEIEAIRDLDLAPDVKNRFLFQYLRVVSATLERELTGGDESRGSVDVPPMAKDVSLNGTWKAYYRLAPGEYREREMELPCNWELVPGIDNYAGTMRFTRVVQVDESLYGKRFLLSFLGVDYFADVWVNGHYVGGHEGFFAPFELDVSRCLRYGEANVIRVAVTSPNEPSGDGIDVGSAWDDFRPAASFPHRKTLIKGTLGHHDARRGGAWNSMTSQDGNTGGVWNDVALRVRGPVRLLPGARLTTRAVVPLGPGGDHAASVELRFAVDNASPSPVNARLHVRIEPANFEGAELEVAAPVVLEPGRSEVVLREDALSPVRLWQTWDQGVPHLYRVRAVLEAVDHPADELVLETGFRTLSVTPIGESTGPEGSFVINDRRIFVRGTNLLPTYWLSEYTDEAVERDFRMLRDAGFNGVILHALVGPKRLYQMANRAGILVEQIFPLQWSYDPSPEFVARARVQIRELVDLLYNEPSVVSYETHNEPDMRIVRGADNRFMDFELHAEFCRLDPTRWATTYSSGNHAYPGQFYPLRDDNGFATLPGRFEENEFEGRRISRHRNMPTEFGIQAMPDPLAFEQLVSEDRVRDVLRRLRTDAKWVAAAGESWESTQTTIATVKEKLGEGSWRAALDAVDWRLLCKLGHLQEEIQALEREQNGAGNGRGRDVEREILSRKLAVLLLDVLHYGGFKGENFWFGNWRPTVTLEDFARASQERQYRLHKDAIETYLNAGVTGPIVGCVSFMFRDADWQAPTWGVVDATGAPKKAFRAYLESNQPLRVTLPQALRRPAKLPGDSWFGTPEEPPLPSKAPWVAAELIVANDTSEPVHDATIEIWVEDAEGRRLHDHAIRLPVDIDAGTGFSYFGRVPEARAGQSPSEWIVPEDLAPGSYFLKASIASADGQVLSTNGYEMFVLDTSFPELAGFDAETIGTLVSGRAAGFHYWSQGQVVYEAAPGVRGFLAGWREAQRRGIDLYETVQGEHFLRHILAELEPLEGSAFLRDAIWRVRSETVSPLEKTAVLMRYLERFLARAEQELEERHATATTETRRRSRT